MSKTGSATQPQSGIAAYLQLSKSGIVTLVLISVLGGYLIGQPFEVRFDWIRICFTLIGVLLLSSGASALNQLQEVDIDARMPRTAGRPLPSGRITLRQAWLFVGVCIPFGLAILATIDGALFLLGLFALFSYNALYTLWWKKRWAHAAVPGAIPGALPILMGYVAAAGQVWNPGALWVFALLFFWQMPHFWALALRYRDDYAEGGFPTLPVSLGTGLTVHQILLWCLAYVALGLGAPLFLHVGLGYEIVAGLMSVVLLWELRGFVRAPESKRWLRFFLWINFSLIAYLGAAAADLWSIYLVRYFTR